MGAGARPRVGGGGRAGGVRPVTARLHIPALVRGDELITATGAACGNSSAALKVRPSIGLAPYTWNQCRDTLAALSILIWPFCSTLKPLSKPIAAASTSLCSDAASA